jgi:hypothetical protein
MPAVTTTRTMRERTQLRAMLVTMRVTGAGHTTWSPSKVPLFSFLSIEPPLSVSAPS